jgi:hypothetical protein
VSAEPLPNSDYFKCLRKAVIRGHGIPAAMGLFSTDKAQSWRLLKMIWHHPIANNIIWSSINCWLLASCSQPASTSHNSHGSATLAWREPEAIEWAWCKLNSTTTMQPHPPNRLQLYQTIFYPLGSHKIEIGYRPHPPINKDLTHLWISFKVHGYH